MDLRPGYAFCDLTEDDLTDVLDLDMWAFPTRLNREELEVFCKEPFEWERGVGVRHEASGELVAMHATFGFSEFPIPGGTMPVSGLTWVGVHPAHRRRGLLRAMIARHFTDAQRRGEPMSALTASEGSIYGRFGYGPATTGISVTIGAGTALHEVPGSDELNVRIEVFSEQAHAELLVDVHRRAGTVIGGEGDGLGRPAWVVRDQPCLIDGYFQELTGARKSHESRRIVIVEREGTPTGYAVIWRKGRTDDDAGVVTSDEVVATDPASARRLWSVLLDLDLTDKVEASVLPTDDHITALVKNPRSVTQRLGDNIWTRILDVPAALAARQYQSDVDVVIGVRDPLVDSNNGRWRLRASAFSPAEVTATEKDADVEIGIEELSTAYLGSVSLAALSQRGTIRTEDWAALRQLSAAFGWPVAAVCTWVW